MFILLRHRKLFNLSSKRKKIRKIRKIKLDTVGLNLRRNRGGGRGLEI